MLRILCFIIPAVLCVSCSTAEKGFDTQSTKLSKDQQSSDVEKILGMPTLRELQKDGTEIWSYGNTRYVEFQNGKVVAFGNAANRTPRTTEANSQQPSKQEQEYKGPPKELGSPCLQNKDCQSRNCHIFRRVCAGTNNCTAALGKTCAVDTDCCKGRCDFGTCRE